MKRPETLLYVKWLKGEIGRDRSQFENFNKGKGIIATRERFLKWRETGEGQKVVVDEDASTPNVMYGKTIILPIAVPGVGECFAFRGSKTIFSPSHRQNVCLSRSRTYIWLRTYSERRCQV